MSTNNNLFFIQRRGNLLNVDKLYLVNGYILSLWKIGK